MESHLERLTAADCRQLLSHAPFGRLVIPTPHFPTVELVSFAVVDGEVVLSVRPGTAGAALTAGARVAFEAGAADHERRVGWSVVVQGHVEDLGRGGGPAGPPEHLLVVRPVSIAGQRVTRPATAEGGSLDICSATGSARCPTTQPGPAFGSRSLSEAEARRLLAGGGEQVGRLALTVNGEPAVYPVNFATDGDAVVFRTRTGSKLAAITRSMATFEVGRLGHTGQGWSVLLEGLAQEVLDADPPALRQRLAALSLEPWPGGDRRRLVRITPFRVRGAAFGAEQHPRAVPLVSASDG